MPDPQQLPCTPWTTPDKMCCPDIADLSGPCVDPPVPVPGVYVWTDLELIVMASKILFEKTCRRFPGSCAVKLRPCDPCKACLGCCTCRYHFIPLVGVFPVLEVTQVTIDGVVIPPASYRVDEFIRLVRTDGLTWPRSQDLGADPTSLTESTFEIQYMTGRAVPEDLQYAAALLACELKRACNGQGCLLPDRVKSVVRDGVSYEILDSSQLSFGGSFGVPLIDAIVRNYKCEKSRPNMTTRIFHPMLDGERYDRSGVRS